LFIFKDISRGVKVPYLFSSPQLAGIHLCRLSKDGRFHDPKPTNYNICGTNIICILDSIWTILSERYYKTSMKEPKVIDSQGTSYTGSTTNMF
jgi:hypothetical protein